MTNSTRTFLVSTGRSGSSLLAAIMADAGANFGLPVPTDWNPGDGALKHPLAQDAGRLCRRAAAVHAGKRYFFLYKYMFDLRLSLAKRKVRQLLTLADSVKADNMDYWLPHVPKMGYAPRIVVPFRSPEQVAQSFMIQAKRNWSEANPYYYRVNCNALLLIYTFGGCAIELEELTDPKETQWAEALASVTGLESAALLEARASRVAPGTSNRTGTSDPLPAIPDGQTQDIYQTLRALRGRHVKQSGPAARRFHDQH